MPGMIRRSIVGKAANASLHEKYVEKASPDAKDDECIRNKGTYLIRNISIILRTRKNVLYILAVSKHCTASLLFSECLTLSKRLTLVNLTLKYDLCMQITYYKRVEEMTYLFT